MKTGPSTLLLLWTLILMTSLAVSFPLLGQTSTQSPRDTLIQAIKEHAQQDAKFERTRENTSGLNSLFGKEAAVVGVPLQEVVKIYEEAYAVAKPGEQWRRFIKPELGWATAFILFILLLFRDVLKETLTNLIKWARDQLYKQLAGHRIFRRKALRHYRRALIQKYQQLIVPFRPGRPLLIHEIYVPLKARGTINTDQIDAYRAIADQKRLMVIGAPGSGKSMLLRQIALSYAEGRLAYIPYQPVTIILELNRLNETDKSLQDHLVEILRLNDFPHAENFVNVSLERGTLMLLLDGLDEVNSSKREQVVTQIKNLLDTFERCRAIITCRSAVYRNDFAETVNQTLELVEFNDQQIQHFLRAWQPSMPAGKSTEQLLRTLHDRPLLMALARNPLLLTIIAYLYADTEFVLPHSRAEFYAQATDVLLRQWHTERNHYRAPQKGLVLQHLALFNQDSGVQGAQDRRSIDLATILEEIKRVLPDLNLPDDEAMALLDELVERSGLLLSIDGGTRYQFAHLTLQEFFAAMALRDEANGLLRRFERDPDAWRETVKLWCGLDHDSTGLIKAIYTDDPVTAFECLADAQKVDPTLAEEMIMAFKTRLGVADSDGDAVIHAFAVVASDQLRPRGEAVFAFLTDTLTTAQESPKRMAAATALSLTNLPGAAQELAKHYTSEVDVRPQLVRMGDIAVPMLTTLAQQGSTNALDDLHAIGTSQAAGALVALLWHPDNDLEIKAAGHLGALLSQPTVEDGLRDYPLTEEQRRAPWLEWVWEPFDEPTQSALPVIAGRIAYLIKRAIAEKSLEATSHIDPRIIIPLIVQDWPKNFHYITRLEDEALHIIQQISILNSLSTDSFTDLYEVLQSLPYIDHETENLIDELIVKSLQRIKDHQILILFHCLDIANRFDLFGRLCRSGHRRRIFFLSVPVATINDWKNISRPLNYSFNESWHYRAILLLAGALSLISITGVIADFLQSPILITWKNGLLIYLFISVLSSWYMMWRGVEIYEGEFEPSDLWISFISPGILLFYPFISIFDLITNVWEQKKITANMISSSIGSSFDLEEVMCLMLSCGFTPGIVYSTSSLLLKYFPLQILVGAWLTLIVLIGELLWIGHRKMRLVQNPLRGILDKSQKITWLFR
jgi:hypothetical protein